MLSGPLGARHFEALTACVRTAQISFWGLGLGNERFGEGEKLTLGSNANLVPETQGNLPSILGYMETPFSIASCTWRPVISSTQSSSSIGSSVTRSRIRKGPGGKTSLARRVPELSSTMSTSCPRQYMPSRTQSATQLPGSGVKK